MLYFFAKHVKGCVNENNCIYFYNYNSFICIQAFPCISTGIFCFDPVKAAKSSLEAIVNWCTENEYFENIEMITIVTFSKRDEDLIIEHYNKVCNNV